MKRLAVASFLVAGAAVAAELVVPLLGAIPAVAAQSAQVPAEQDAPVATPSTVTDQTDEEGASRPWGRIAILAPISVAVGVLAVIARRTLRTRGWIEG